MTLMEKQPETREPQILWAKISVAALLFAATAYAVKHPHSFFYYLLKFIIAPIP